MVTTRTHDAGSAVELVETITKTKVNDEVPSRSGRPGKRRKLDGPEVTAAPEIEVAVFVDNTSTRSPVVGKDLPVRSKDGEVDESAKAGNDILPHMSPHAGQATEGGPIPASHDVEESSSARTNEDEETQDAPNGSLDVLVDPPNTIPETPALVPEGRPSPKEGTQVDSEGTATKQISASTNLQPSKAIHVRFGSEEPANPPQSAVNLPLQPTLEVHDTEQESGDEAPEAITLSSGLEKARESAQDAIKAAERQEAASKKKRQARDAQLKSQAQTSRKSKKRKSDVLTNLNNQEHDDPSLSETLDHLHLPPASRLALPALLPDSILATEPAVRPPTPPPEAETRMVKTKRHQFFEAEEKPPREIKRGPVSVRVLESNRSRLPPKASRTSKALKEAWLSGRRGREGMNGFERQKIPGGFLRR
ncbi:MAG: hypothetical protein M1812_001239 [Candelaria pacifica]|nr:MAG: hypothetical protein M1812_001239 [Candelaria pacifica]